MRLARLTTYVLAAALTAGSTAAFAEEYGTAGCGLGAMVFKDQPGKIQIVAATINNLVSPQTFAITTGTSNCKDGGATASATYINVNQHALRKDIARGNGETLAGLSRILNCSDSARLGTTLQQNYNSIFPTEKVDAIAADRKIQTMIMSDKSLAGSCSSATI